MGVMFITTKWSLFALNVACLLLGVGDICVNAMAFEEAQPGTDAHTFFILVILLCSLLCLTTIIGCYAALSEVFGINVIYSLFILSLLIIQYLQMKSFQPHDFYFNNLQRLESAWRSVETQSKYMDGIQSDFSCCGLFNAYDYSYKHLTIPYSCYTPIANAEKEGLQVSTNQLNVVGCLETVWKYYNVNVHRHVAFDWALVITELVTFIYSIILNILILKRSLRPRLEYLQRAVVREFAHQNHIGSTQLFLSN